MWIRERICHVIVDRSASASLASHMKIMIKKANVNPDRSAGKINNSHARETKIRAARACALWFLQFSLIFIRAPAQLCNPKMSAWPLLLSRGRPSIEPCSRPVVNLALYPVCALARSVASIEIIISWKIYDKCRVLKAIRISGGLWITVALYFGEISLSPRRQPPFLRFERIYRTNYLFEIVVEFASPAYFTSRLR